MNDSFELPAILDSPDVSMIDPEFPGESIEQLLARADAMMQSVGTRFHIPQPPLSTVTVRASSELESAINNVIEIPSTPDDVEDDVIFVGRQSVAENISIIDLCSPDKGPTSSVLTTQQRHGRPTSAAPAASKPIQSVGENDKPGNTVLQCSICLESSVGRSPHTTTCGHIFCGECIKMSIKFHRKCPMCNKPLNLKNIWPVYI